MENDIVFKGNPGILVAITFITLEMLLLPLFEYTRDSLSIAVVRGRLAQGKEVKLCRERSIAIALGLSDGLPGYSAYAIVPRALKIFFRMSLIISIFVWEFQLNTLHRPELKTFRFSNQGPPILKNESLLIFPLLFTGFPEAPLSPDTLYNKNGKQIEVEEDIRFNFLSHCLLEEDNGTRVAYLAIYSHNENGDRKIHCMNGTSHREKAKFMTFNGDPTQAVRSNVSSINVGKLLSIDPSNRTLIYTMKTIIPNGAPLNGTHHGFLRVLRENARSWRADGLLIHSTKGTVMRFYHSQMPWSRNGTMCRNKQMPDSYANYDCLYDFKGLRDFRIEFSGNRKGILQDIDLRVREIPLFEVGALRNVLFGWSHAGLFDVGPLNFVDELWAYLSSTLFYFSVPPKTQLLLRLGTPKMEVQMTVWSTVILLAVMFLFIAYCGTSFALDYQSRIRTGIRSQCVTRTAVLEMLSREANGQGQLLTNGRDNTLAIGISSGNTEIIRLTSAET